MSTRRFDPSRRALIGKLGGAALALPFLQILEGKARAQATAPKAKNFLMITAPNGIHPSTFWPTGGERDFVLGDILAPLQKHRDKLLIVGPQLSANRTPVSGTGLYWKKPTGIHRAWLATTGHAATAPRTPQTGDGLNVKTSHPSVDQLIAHHLKMARPAGMGTAFDSLEFGVRPVGGDVPCIVNFNMTGAPMARMANDVAAWDRVFGSLMPPSANDPSRARRAAVSNFLNGRFAALTPTLGREDRQLLDGHLQSLREIEARLGGTAAPGCGAVRGRPFMPAAPTDPANPKSDIPALYANMQDMVALAFACDRTRVASISLSFEGGGGLAAPWLGFNNEYHALSHKFADPALRDRYNKVLRWSTEMVARMLDKLKEHTHPEGGTLYDNTLVWWMFRHGDGNAHAHFGVPGIIAGGAGGYFGPMGRYLNLGPTEHPSFVFSLVNAMGINIKSFGIAENMVTGGLAALRS